MDNALGALSFILSYIRREKGWWQIQIQLQHNTMRNRLNKKFYVRRFHKQQRTEETENTKKKAHKVERQRRQQQQSTRR